MPDAPLHIPVFLDRTIELLEPALGRPGAVLVDATLGLGGHAEAFLQRFPQLTYVGLDRDRDALALSAERLAPFADRIRLVHSVYDRIGEVLEELSIRGIAGVLFDLGVSTMQLDRVERGFSYSKDAPLDMRMDDTAPLTAARVLAEYPESELRRIFYQYGEEKLAPRYAKRIVEGRQSAPLVTSAQLVALIDAATPAALRRAGHPAKRVF
ncbi:MAG: 16S rRNA (cytosine(1402)-N(4))-methyltransferase RsmH, partial [Rhodoglobus sp.]